MREDESPDPVSGLESRPAHQSLEIEGGPNHSGVEEDKIHHDLGGPLGDFLVRTMSSLFTETDPMEARGLWIDQLARGTIFMSYMFLGPALLESSKAAGGCTENDEDDDHCRVYGIRPSSLLSTMATIGGVLSVMIMPVVGAMIDHTPHRWKVGFLSAVLLVLGKGLETMISQSTWLWVAIIQIVTAICFTIHVLTALPYVSELSKDPSEQTRYSASISIAFFAVCLILSVSTLIISTIINADDILTARISQVSTTTTSALLFLYAWMYLIPQKPAYSQVPDGTSLLQCGFQKIFHTCNRLQFELKELKWFYLSVAFNNAGSNGIATISTTFMSHYLDMSGSEIGLVFLISLFFSLPGTKIAQFVTKKLDPLKSNILSWIFFIVITFTAALTLRGPAYKNYMYIIGALWGILYGWIDVMHDAIVMSIVPRNQESEMMGLYIFCQNIFGWMPPLLFTILNELGAHITIGFASLNLFFTIGIFCVLMMGKFENVLESVNPSHRSEETTQPGENFKSEPTDSEDLRTIT